MVNNDRIGWKWTFRLLFSIINVLCTYVYYIYSFDIRYDVLVVSHTTATHIYPSRFGCVRASVRASVRACMHVCIVFYRADDDFKLKIMGNFHSKWLFHLKFLIFNFWMCFILSHFLTSTTVSNRAIGGLCYICIGFGLKFKTNTHTHIYIGFMLTV